jgi:mRNA-degrading endonuclease RelE of RelBE toxin-antitoxin system
MSAEIIRGIDFKNKKVKVGGEGSGNKNEGVAGVLSIHFFYKNFILGIKKTKNEFVKQRVFNKNILTYLMNVVNPYLELNKKRPKWVEESLKNLLRAVALIQSDLDLDYKKTNEEALKQKSESLKYRIVFGGGGFFRSRIFEGEVGDENDLQRLKEILEPFA